jgi:hypothetical protein
MSAMAYRPTSLPLNESFLIGRERFQWGAGHLFGHFHSVRNVFINQLPRVSHFVMRVLVQIDKSILPRIELI